MSAIPVHKLNLTQQQLVSKVTGQLTALEEELNSLFPGRKHLVKSTVLALAMGENVLIYGRPGTAKTLFMRTVTDALEGARVFGIVLNAQTPPSHLIGTQILKKLDDGVVDFNLENSLISCDFAWLDEYGNANNMTATSLNMILHERAFVHGVNYHQARLRTALAATNLEPKDFGADPRIKANLDRFMFKCEVNDLVERADQLAMLNVALGGNGSFRTQTHIKTADLIVFQDIIRDLNFIGDATLLSAYLDLVEKLEKTTGTNYTDRSMVKIIQILEAIAFFDKQAEVQLDDLVGLEPAFVSGGDAALSTTFQKAVAEVTKKYEKMVGKEIDGAELALIDQLTSQLPSVTRQSTADELLVAYRKITEIKKAMATIKPTLQPTATKLDELQTKVSERESKITSYMQGI